MPAINFNDANEVDVDELESQSFRAPTSHISLNSPSEELGDGTSHISNVSSTVYSSNNAAQMTNVHPVIGKLTQDALIDEDDLDQSTLTDYGAPQTRRQSRFEAYTKSGEFEYESTDTFAPPEESAAANPPRFNKAVTMVSTSTSVATPEPPRRQPLVDDQTFYSEYSADMTPVDVEESRDTVPDLLSPEVSKDRRFTNAVIHAAGGHQHRVSALTHFTGLSEYTPHSTRTFKTHDGEERRRSSSAFCVVMIACILFVAGVVPIVVCGIAGQCSSSDNEEDVTNTMVVNATNATVAPTINPNPPMVVVTTVPPRPPTTNSNPAAMGPPFGSNNQTNFVEIELGSSGATMRIPDYTLPKLDDPLSPQANAYLWFIYSYAAEQLQAMPMWRRQQVFALASFYFAFNGARWNALNQQSWLDTSINECQWSIDIICYFEPESQSLQMPPPLGGGMGAQNVDLSGRVRAIRMLDFVAPIELAHTMGINGVPPEVELLQWMQALEMQRLQGLEETSLDELLPFAELAKLPFLWSLDATENQLTGTLPTDLGLLTPLRYLKLYANQFTGTLPSELGLLTDLQQAWFDNNSLTGTVPAPVCDLTTARNGLDVDIDCEEIICPAETCNCDCAQSHDEGRWL